MTQTGATVPFFSKTLPPVAVSHDNTAYAIAWSPDGKYFAVGGVRDSALGNNNIVVYEWNGSSIIDIDQTNHTNKTVIKDDAQCVTWSSNGRYLAVGGRTITPSGDNDVAVYEWSGSSLIDLDPGTDTNKVVHGDWVESVAWSPDGRYLAVGGRDEDFAVLSDINVVVYEWNGVSLIDVDQTSDTNKVKRGERAYSVAWSPDGKYLAVGGNDDVGSTPNIVVYEWDGGSLIDVDEAGDTNKVRQGWNAFSLAWSPDGRYLVVGGDNQSFSGISSTNVVVYEWDGLSLLDVDKTSHTNKKSQGSGAYGLAWSQDGRYLAVVGGSEDFPGLLGVNGVVYEWDGLSLIDIDPASHTNKQDHGTGAFSVAWSPFGGHCAVGGYPASTLGNKEIGIYMRDYLIDGTIDARYFNTSVTCTRYNLVHGNVWFANNLTLLDGATVEFNITNPIVGTINLNDTGTLYLQNDLHLSTEITGGLIAGNGYSILLQDNGFVTDNAILQITSDTVINGQGNDFSIGSLSQILVDANVTLTLKNMTLKNTLNNSGLPFILLSDASSQLALDDVTICPHEDFYFTEGQLFLHNDVVFTGTNWLRYNSDAAMYIDTFATLYFDTGTSFAYAPTGTNDRALIHMTDKTSRLFLDGATLDATTIGVQLTNGTLVLDHKNNFYNGGASGAITFGNGVAVNDLNVELMPAASVQMMSGTLEYQNVV